MITYVLAEKDNPNRMMLEMKLLIKGGVMHIDELREFKDPRIAISNIRITGYCSYQVKDGKIYHPIISFS